MALKDKMKSLVGKMMADPYNAPGQDTVATMSTGERRGYRPAPVVKQPEKKRGRGPEPVEPTYSWRQTGTQPTAFQNSGYQQPVQQTGFQNSGYQQPVQQTGFQNSSYQQPMQQTGFQNSGYQQPVQPTGYQTASQPRMETGYQSLFTGKRAQEQDNGFTSAQGNRKVARNGLSAFIGRFFGGKGQAAEQTPPDQGAWNPGNQPGQPAGNVSTAYPPVNNGVGGGFQPNGNGGVSTAYPPVNNSFGGGFQPNGNVSTAYPPVNNGVGGGFQPNGNVSTAYPPVNNGVGGGFQPNGNVSTAYPPVNNSFRGGFQPNGNTSAGHQPGFGNGFGAAAKPASGASPANHGREQISANGGSRPAGGSDNVVYMNPNSIVDQNGTAYTSAIRIAQPVSTSSCYRVIEFLRNRESVLINTELIKSDEERLRCLDLLFGASFAMNCTYTRVASRCLYLITPNDVQVTSYASVNDLHLRDNARNWPGSEQNNPYDTSWQRSEQRAQSDAYAGNRRYGGHHRG